MKWFRITSAVIATLGLTTAAHAGLLDLFGTHGSSKSCGCAPCCQPQCCKPTIKKPCCPNIYTYQRKLSDIKPPCCDQCCAPKNCCKPCDRGCDKGCVKGCDKGCAPACAPKCAPTCAAPVNCAPKCAPGCAPKCEPTCAAPVNCAPKCAPACAPKCAAPTDCAPKCAPNSCCPQQDCCQKSCCDFDPCELAKVIYRSQTACYAKDRRDAISDLGNDYDCNCSPLIMQALIMGLNDTDERVRAEAADEIGDQLRENRCCCSKEVVAALTASLGDCDRKVRHEAQEALEHCGYEVVDGCCECVSCDPCSRNYGGKRSWMKGGGDIKPTPAGKQKKAAPPAPGTEKVYFPATLRRSRPYKSRARLSNLFGLLN